MALIAAHYDCDLRYWWPSCLPVSLPAIKPSHPLFVGGSRLHSGVGHAVDQGGAPSGAAAAAAAYLWEIAVAPRSPGAGTGNLGSRALVSRPRDQH